MLIGWKSITYKNFRELLNLSGVYLKGETLFSGWVGKIRNNLYFRIIG